MTTLDLFEFTLKSNLAAPDTVTWIYMLLIGLLVIFGYGLAWGRMWNRDWSLGGHFGSLILVLLCGLGAAYAVFNLQGVSRMESWFGQQRLTLARSIADSVRFKHSLLISTWDQLLSKDKDSQKDLSPPLEGGNEVRLKSPDDAFALASTAAEETRSTLRNKLPFSLGVPISTRSPTDIATETVDTVSFDPNRFPTIAAATNEWASTAATFQTNHTLETAYATLKPGRQSLKAASLCLLIASLAIPLVAIPMNRPRCYQN